MKIKEGPAKISYASRCKKMRPKWLISYVLDVYDQINFPLL